MKRLKMIKKHSSIISLATLLLCLCLGSLVVLPITNVVGLSLPEIAGSASENYNLFDQAEIDADLFVAIIVSVTIAVLSFIKPRLKSLDFLSVFLSPVSPPPEHA
jgi:hypothetical protein